MKDLFCNKEVLLDFDQINQTMVLKEEENNQFITIKGVPLDAILLKLDVNKLEYKRKSMYFSRETDFIHKGCDYCLIIPSVKKILLFELKSMKPKEKNYIAQFKSSEIFMNYCIKLHNYKNNCNLKYEFNRILLCTKHNSLMTSTKKVPSFNLKDNKGENMSIKAPGFPSFIRLEKLY